jgi:hypothetical protein
MRSVIGDSFLKAANATGRRCPFAQSLRVPVQRSAHLPPAPVPLTNPNERRSRACAAGRGRGPAQSSACSPAISRILRHNELPNLLSNIEPDPGPVHSGRKRPERETHPAPPGPSTPRPSIGGRQRPDSSVTAANWPPVPTSSGGGQPEPTPKDRAALAPGGPKLEPAQARRQLMRHSGRTTRTVECTAHWLGSGGPLGSVKRRAPHVH